MRSKGTQQSSRLMKIITIPIRILAKARDMYVESMNSCADGANYGNYMGLPATMPRSFSVSSARSSNSENEDLRELIRSASASAMSRSNNNSNNKKTSTMNNSISCINTRSSASMMDMYMMKQPGSRRMPRSCSVGMSKIDEERPCDFGNEELDGYHLGNSNVASNDIMYPRSRSYAVSRRNVVF